MLKKLLNSILIMLISVTLVSGLAGVTYSKMTCNYSGDVSISFGGIDDCCGVESTSEGDEGCCSFETIKIKVDEFFSGKVAKFFSPKLIFESFSKPVSLLFSDFHIKKPLNRIFHPPPPNNEIILLISSFRI